LFLRHGPRHAHGRKGDGPPILCCRTPCFVAGFLFRKHSCDFTVAATAGPSVPSLIPRRSMLFDRLLDEVRPCDRHDGSKAVTSRCTRMLVDVPTCASPSNGLVTSGKHLLPHGAGSRHDAGSASTCRCPVKLFGFGRTPRDTSIKALRCSLAVPSPL